MDQKQNENADYPADIGLEKAILARAIESEIYGPILGLLSANDFFWEENRLIYEILVTVESKMNLTYEKVLGEFKIRGMKIELPSSEKYNITGDADWYIEKLKELARRREIIRHAKNLQARMMDYDEDVLTSEMQMLHVLGEKKDDQGLRHIEKIEPEAMASFEKMFRREKTGISYGFKCLDELIGGIEMGDFILLAGRPSTGKTTLAINIGLNVSSSGTPVYLFSIEMMAKKVMMRIMCCESQVNMAAAKYRGMTAEELSKITSGAERLRKLPYFLETSWMATPAKIRSKTHQIIRKHGPGLVIIDYIQIVRPDQKNQNRAIELSEISGALKRLGNELEIPIMALSQFSRAVEMGNRPPILSDLRDSGSLEQDGDVIIGLNPNPEADGIVDAYVLKNKDGATGKIQLRYEKQFHKFSDVPAGPGTPGWQDNY